MYSASSSSSSTYSRYWDSSGRPQTTVIYTQANLLHYGQTVPTYIYNSYWPTWRPMTYPPRETVVPFGHPTVSSHERSNREFARLYLGTSQAATTTVTSTTTTTTTAAPTVSTPAPERESAVDGLARMKNLFLEQQRQKKAESRKNKAAFRENILKAVRGEVPVTAAGVGPSGQRIGSNSMSSRSYVGPKRDVDRRRKTQKTMFMFEDCKNLLKVARIETVTTTDFVEKTENTAEKMNNSEKAEKRKDEGFGEHARKAPRVETATTAEPFHGWQPDYRAFNSAVKNKATASGRQRVETVTTATAGPSSTRSSSPDGLEKLRRLYIETQKKKKAERRKMPYGTQAMKGSGNRTQLTEAQNRFLHSVFREAPQISPEAQAKVAAELSVTRETINDWFKEQRNQMKKLETLYSPATSKGGRPPTVSR